MNKKKIILLIACVLVIFAIMNVIAREFCNPSQASELATFIEKNIPKPNSENINELRHTWAILFMKYCGQSSNQIL